MIFVTIGTSLPFDRLIRAVDALAPGWPGEEFFAQIGDGAYEPRNMRFVRMLSAADYAGRIEASRLIVAHAGMGSLITAIDACKPIVVMPRRLVFDEINTDHQAATAKRWIGRRGVHVAMQESDLAAAVCEAMAASAAGTAIKPTDGFVEKLTAFIESC